MAPSGRVIDREYNLVMVGEGRLGKTSLASRFTLEGFSVNNPTTTLPQTSTRIWKKDDKLVKMTLCDLPCTLNNILPNFFRKADGIVMVYDITNRVSFYQMMIWMDLLRPLLRPNARFFAVGTRSDLTDSRRVTYDRAIEFYRKYRVPVYETSSFLGTGIEETFSAMLQFLDDHYVRDELSDEYSEAVGKPVNPTYRCRCF